MSDQPIEIHFHINVKVPVMAVQKFADEIGMTLEWVESRIAQGLIPIMPKRSKNEKTLVNNVLYWMQAIQQGDKGKTK